jgi:hypothetical protein
MRLTCPVSGTENEDRESCKQCGADLRPLVLVEEFNLYPFEEGTQNLQEGHLAEALTQLSTAVNLHPESADVHWKLAETLQRLGLQEPALDHLGLAVTAGPDRDDIRDAHSSSFRTGYIAYRCRTACGIAGVPSAGLVLSRAATVEGRPIHERYESDSEQITASGANRGRSPHCS